MPSMYLEIFHTVPIVGTEMTRDSEHKKIGFTFPTSWKHYSQTRNNSDTPILGAIAGTDFIGIDIDNTPMFIEALEQGGDGAKYIATSVPANANKGGHLLFAYDRSIVEFLQSRNFKKGVIDVQMGNKLIFLATPANRTKQLETPELKDLSDLSSLPISLLLWLDRNSDQPDVSIRMTNDIPESSYGYMLAGALTPAIVPEISPSTNRLAHPDDLDDGATEWANAMRLKLMTDSTVSPEIFRKTVEYVYSLWTTTRAPMKQMDYDIKRDIEHPKFVYNPNWRTDGFTYPDSHSNLIEVFFDISSSSLIRHNRNTGELQSYKRDGDMIRTLTATHAKRKRFTSEQILKKATTVRTVNSPMIPPLVSSPDPMNHPLLNLFRPTEGTQILQELIDVDTPRHPEYILKFLEHLVPSEENRTRLLGFLAHKFCTFQHSPLIFVLAGVGGAGKGVFVNTILGYFTGDARKFDVDLDRLESNFNSRLAHTDILLMDEVGEGMTTKENAKLVAKLKELTGRPKLFIENKGVDIADPVDNFVTPVLTTNMDAKLITSTEAEDRRLVMFKTREKMTDWCGMYTGDYIALMTKELPHFAYYLRDIMIDHSDYTNNRNWKDKDYFEFIEDTTTPTDKLKGATLQRFLDILEEVNVSHDSLDSMFGTSLPDKPARCLLYNTTGTRQLGLTSLQDVAESNVQLSNTIRRELAEYKVKRSYQREGKNYTIQVIEFDDPYEGYTQIHEIN